MGVLVEGAADEVSSEGGSADGFDDDVGVGGEDSVGVGGEEFAVRGLEVWEVVAFLLFREVCLTLAPAASFGLRRRWPVLPA